MQGIKAKNRKYVADHNLIHITGYDANAKARKYGKYK